MRVISKHIFIFVLIFVSLFFVSCEKQENKNVLYVYNWGIYIADRVVEDFEKKYGIKVIYDTFDTNEEMYTVIKDNARKYDILCPTDYMIEKMINKNMLHSFDFNDLSNINSVDKRMLEIMKSFDKDNTYAIPYVHSTIGIVYNKTLLDEKNLPYPTSWKDLFDEKYNQEIIMQDAMRDVLMVGLKKNHFSLNTFDDDELDIATDDLVKQKDFVYSYAIDSARDKMVNGEASIAVMYSGEIRYISEEGSKYEFGYVLPAEGVNLTIDAWVIPENADNKENAKLWIDYMLDENIALRNYEYMHYGISNTKAIDLIEKKYGKNEINNEVIFPDLSDINKYELYKDLGDYEEIYLEKYKRIKSK